MTARPHISRNERETAEIGAFEVGNVAPLSRPAVDGDDLEALVRGLVELRRGQGHLVDEVARAQRDGLGRRRVDVAQRGDAAVAEALDAAEHRAALAEHLGEAPRVDARDAGHAGLGEPGAEGLGRVPVAVVRGVVLADDGRRVDRLGLEGLPRQQGLRGVAERLVGHAVVADHGVGHRQALAAVGRVRERLGVADHASLEDDLAERAVRGHLGAEGPALEDGAVLEDDGDARVGRRVAAVLARAAEDDAAARAERRRDRPRPAPLERRERAQRPQLPRQLLGPARARGRRPLDDQAAHHGAERALKALIPVSNR